MCGIIALLQNKENLFKKNIMESLNQIQNRGYDSAGISYFNNLTINTIKYASDNVSALKKIDDNLDNNTKSNCIIAHTRWATHGSKTDYNSHPHISFDGKLSLVHNGIIDNYQLIKKNLMENDIPFKSETDTEVISNLIEFNYIKTKDLKDAIKISISQMTGTWGLAIIHIDYPNQIFCIRHGSPLLIGNHENMAMIVSELSGFANKVKNYFVLENQDLTILSIKDNKIDISTEFNYQNSDLNDNAFELTPYPYEHWTLKEIMEQPEAINRALGNGGRIINNKIRLGGLECKRDILLKTDNVIILGCGTSLHAGLIGMNYFKELCNFNTVQVFDGAEFSKNDIPKIGTTILIYLSQSGETKDLHRCIEIGNDNNLIQVGLVNVVDSLIAREVDCGCYLNAGREVGVASTKSFTNQVILLLMVALWFSQELNDNEIKRTKIINDIRNLSKHYNEALEISIKHKRLLVKFINHSSLFILGKGNSRYIAREGALKIKELCYNHAEGYGGSSLKHGPFALLDEIHPVILLVNNDKHFYKMNNAYQEIISRKSEVLVIGNRTNNFTNEIILPNNKTFQDLLSIIPIQIGSYYTSILNQINCDQPKNLAKCVNVE